MNRVDVSEAADADLAAILEYGVARFGVEVGENYVTSFNTSFALIGAHPSIGAIHDAVRPPIRSLSHGSHRIFYDVLDDRVIVARVLHKAMDVDRVVLERGD